MQLNDKKNGEFMGLHSVKPSKGTNTTGCGLRGLKQKKPLAINRTTCIGLDIHYKYKIKENDIKYILY